MIRDAVRQMKDSSSGIRVVALLALTVGLVAVIVAGVAISHTFGSAGLITFTLIEVVILIVWVRRRGRGSAHR